MFCRDLAEDLGHPVQANAYLTPVGGVGFRHHWDTHAVVVVQLSGQKTWELTRPVIKNPSEPDGSWRARGFTDEQRRRLENQPPDFAPTLTPGQILWVPRGWVHAPYSPEGGTGPSLHVTFGVLEYTRQRLYELLLNLVAGDDDAREALQPQPDVAMELAAARGDLVRRLQLLDLDRTQQAAQKIIRREHAERYGLPETTFQPL